MIAMEYLRLASHHRKQEFGSVTARVAAGNVQGSDLRHRFDERLEVLQFGGYRSGYSVISQLRVVKIAVQPILLEETRDAHHGIERWRGKEEAIRRIIGNGRNQLHRIRTEDGKIANLLLELG